VADYLDARAGKGSKPASLGRYKASIAKIHQLLDLKDPTQAPLVKLRLAAVRREKGTAQKQARPLRFKGPVRDVERDKARGLNVARCSRSCGDDLPGLRDRALLSAAYDTGLRASELVAVAVEHIVEAIDPDARLAPDPAQQGRSGRGGGDRLSQSRAPSRRSRPGREAAEIYGGAAVPAGAGAALQGPSRGDAVGGSTASRAARPGICARRSRSPRYRRGSNMTSGPWRCIRDRSGRSFGRSSNGHSTLARCRSDERMIWRGCSRALARIRRGSGSTRISSRAARISPALWMRCGGSRRECRSPIIAISLLNMELLGASCRNWYDCPWGQSSHLTAPRRMTVFGKSSRWPDLFQTILRKKMRTYGDGADARSHIKC
jgi:hypothetical protein